MSTKLGKKRAAVNPKVDRFKMHTLEEAMPLVKEVSLTKFDASVDIHIRLGVDPRKPDQALRGTVGLPHGTGKTKRVVVFCTPDKAEEAKAAGADYVGLEDLMQKVQEGWTDFDVAIAMPQVMAQVGRLGRVLGPRGLMPNPKVGTVTFDVSKAVSEAKAGKVEFRVERAGIVHARIGKRSFGPEALADNAKSILNALAKAKPAAAKGIYMRSITLSSTMGPGFRVDPLSLTVEA